MLENKPNINTKKRKYTVSDAVKLQRSQAAHARQSAMSQHERSAAMSRANRKRWPKVSDIATPEQAETVWREHMRD